MEAGLGWVSHGPRLRLLAAGARERSGGAPAGVVCQVSLTPPQGRERPVRVDRGEGRSVVSTDDDRDKHR
jgi:hypothetical protein